MKLKLLALAIVSFLSLAFLAQPVEAANASDFKAGHIIDDSKFTNNNSMNAGDIHNFLVSKNSVCLINYNGTGWVANVIKNHANTFGINPQVLLVTLQKENGLITTTSCDAWKYRTAMGFACPDNGSCNPEYFGFDKQVYQAARHFRGYFDQNAGWFVPFSTGTHFIGYNPNSGCGGTNVTIFNRATAALYSYTPYQPNAAALNNLYGGGDSCSAYGNRNFWRDFTDWFGPTTGDGYVLARNVDDNSQWVVYNNVKQYVPSADIKQAWNLPDTPVDFTGSQIASYIEGPWFGRLFHRIGSPDLYFADSGKKYRVTSISMRDTWGMSGEATSFVTGDLFNLPSNGGDLTYSVKRESAGAIYLMDGCASDKITLRQYSSPDVRKAWDGDHDIFTTLSDDYFDSVNYCGTGNTVGSALSGFTVKSGSNPTQYQVVAGQKLYLSGGVASVYNQSPATISEATVSRLITNSDATAFIKWASGPEVYMVDNGQKHHVQSGSLLSAWAGGTHTHTVTGAMLNLISTGNVVNSYLGDVSGQLYLVDAGKKMSVPSSLDSAYRNSGTPYSTTSSLVNLLGNGSAATGFLKTAGSPAVYLIDNGAKRHITSAAVYTLWNGSRGEALTNVSDSAGSQFATGGSIDKAYASNGTTNYAFDNGTYYAVSGAMQSEWGFGSPVSVAAATIARFSDSGTSLTNKVRSGVSYYLVKYGKSHLTFNTNMASIWGIDTAGTNFSSTFVNSIPIGVPLTLFVRSTDQNDLRIFAADSGDKLYTFASIPQVQNYGYLGGNLLQLTPADINAMTVTDAKDIFRRGSSSDYAVLDFGGKRNFTTGDVQTEWVTGSNTISVSDYLWNYIPTGSNIGGTIKASAPNVYAMDDGQKRWIQSGNTYLFYAPYYSISDFLNLLIAEGSPIP